MSRKVGMLQAGRGRPRPRPAPPPPPPRVAVPAQEPRLYVVARLVDGKLDLVYGSLARTRPEAWSLAVYAYSGTHGTADMLRTMRRAGYRALPAHLEVVL